MAAKMLNLGTTGEDDKFELPARVLRKHIVVLGASGSGKTVLGKLFVEEATIAGIPSIIIDPQGDLASLAMPAEEQLHDGNGKTGKGTGSKSAQDTGEGPASGNGKPETGRGAALFRARAEVRIFTPASLKGIPLSINPLKPPSRDMAEDEKIRAMDLISGSIARLLGFSRAEEGEQAGKYIYSLLEQLWKKGIPVTDFSLFSEIAESPESIGLEDAASIITESGRKKVARKLRYLSLGIDKLLFNFGVPSGMEVYMRPVEEGKVPVNVIYLNTLSSEEHKQFFVSMIAEDIYEWMLQKPSRRTQVLFYMDEVAPYLPPHPRNPPAKEMLKMLFKQGRKYGVSCLMCTQNPADVDYKAMAQASTWALGRMMTKQDIEKVRHVIRAAGESEDILSELPVAKPGRFIFLCPDVLPGAQRMDTRWLYTVHETLGEDALDGLMDPGMKEHFDGLSGRGGISSPLEKELKETIRSMKRTEEEAEAQRQLVHELRHMKYEDGSPVVTGKLKVARLKFTLNRAMKLARRHLEGNILFKTERVDENVELCHLPLWQIEFVREGYEGLLKLPVKVPILADKKIESTNYIYFHAGSGKLLQVRGDEINFSNVISKSAEKIKDLDDKEIEFEEKSGGSMKDVLTLSVLDRITIEEKAVNMFGLSVKKSRLVFLPYWEFNIAEKDSGVKHTLLIDAATGKKINLREKVYW